MSDSKIQLLPGRQNSRTRHAVFSGIKAGVACATSFDCHQHLVRALKIDVDNIQCFPGGEGHRC